MKRRENVVKVRLYDVKKKKKNASRIDKSMDIDYSLSICVPVLVISYTVCVHVYVYVCVRLLLTVYGWMAHYLLSALTMAWRPGCAGHTALV